MKEKEIKEVLDRLNKIFMEAGSESVKKMMHFRAMNEFEKEEIEQEKIKVYDMIHQVLKVSK